MPLKIYIAKLFHYNLFQFFNINFLFDSLLEIELYKNDLVPQFQEFRSHQQTAH